MLFENIEVIQGFSDCTISTNPPQNWHTCGLAGYILLKVYIEAPGGQLLWGPIVIPDNWGRLDTQLDCPVRTLCFGTKLRGRTNSR